VSCRNEVLQNMCVCPAAGLAFYSDLQGQLISQIYSGPSHYVFNQSFSQTAANDLCYMHSHGECEGGWRGGFMWQAVPRLICHRRTRPSAESNCRRLDTHPCVGIIHSQSPFSRLGDSGRSYSVTR